MEDENKIVDRILAFDCAVGIGSVAVLNGDDILASSADLDGSPSRAEEILQLINSVLVGAGTRQRDLNKIAVSVGPGSYSGIRIGLATSAGLAAALSIPCVGVSVLDAISQSAKTKGKFVAAVGVGKRHIGWSSFEVTSGGTSSLSVSSMRSDEDFGDSFKTLGDATLLCDPSLASRVRAVVPETVTVLEIRETVAELVGRSAFLHPERTSLRPIYLRDQAGVSGQPVIQQ